jgi:hypothetical protein
LIVFKAHSLSYKAQYNFKIVNFMTFVQKIKK